MNRKDAGCRALDAARNPQEPIPTVIQTNNVNAVYPGWTCEPLEPGEARFLSTAFACAKRLGIRLSAADYQILAMFADHETTIAPCCVLDWVYEVVSLYPGLKAYFDEILQDIDRQNGTINPQVEVALVRHLNYEALYVDGKLRTAGRHLTAEDVFSTLGISVDQILLTYLYPADTGSELPQELYELTRQVCTNSEYGTLVEAVTGN